jgi:predicted MPP superfamily phosphohydrolase
MRTRARAGLAALAILGAGLAVRGLVEPHRPVLVRTTIPCPGLRSPVKILVVSDVDFPRATEGRALMRRTAETEKPDALFVPGDFLDRAASLDDAAVVRAAGAELAAVPAPSGRYIALGEEESDGASALVPAWGPPALTVGSNDAHVVPTPGGALDLFIADVRTDPAPWGLEPSGPRGTLTCRGRYVTSSARYAEPSAAAWGDVEITLAFRIDDPVSYVDFRFGWRAGGDKESGDGWRLIRHAYDPDFRLLPRFPGEHQTTGRARSGYEPAPGLWHRVRIRMEDDGTATRVRARFWPERGVEPRVWLVDVLSRGPARRHTGTIGFGARFGDRRLADLRVTDLAGRTLLAEAFDDRARFDASWTQTSKLAAWAKRASDRPRLVLSHHPDVAVDLGLIGAAPPALVVAGHTHGGQVSVPGWGPLFTSTRLPHRLAAGLGSWRGIPLFVTVGIGTSVIPVRLFVPPEVDLLTLEPAPLVRSAGAGDHR